MEICWIHNNKTVVDTSINFKNYYRKLSKKQRTRAYNFSIFTLALTATSTELEAHKLLEETTTKMVDNANNLMNSIEINNSAMDFLLFGGSPTKILIFAAIIFGALFLKPFMKWLYKDKYGIRGCGYTEKTNKDIGKDLLVLIICLVILFLPIFLF